MAPGEGGLPGLARRRFACALGYGRRWRRRGAGPSLKHRLRVRELTRHLSLPVAGIFVGWRGDGPGRRRVGCRRHGPNAGRIVGHLVRQQGDQGDCQHQHRRQRPPRVALPTEGSGRAGGGLVGLPALNCRGGLVEDEPIELGWRTVGGALSRYWRERSDWPRKNSSKCLDSLMGPPVQTTRPRPAAWRPRSADGS